ncbi:unnamed protein product [Mytilus edulis]|uniref:Uncharacterized protein n=1 Tax=Mytilus edulis TaxID=6550 RepID=A0A8S3R922_MYTED|nr:unnamed protein product [Mytilus edulis]
MESQNTSDILNQSRDVLYGEENKTVSLENLYQLMLDMNNRLTSIEKGMKQVNQINRTLTNLVSELHEVKSTVSKIDKDVKSLNKRCDKQDSEINNVITDNFNLNKDLTQLNKTHAETDKNLQGISDFMDDFKLKHEQNTKDVKYVKTTVTQVKNDLNDQATELRHEIKSTLSDIREENEELKDTVLDLQCRSMKNNLVFTGLHEIQEEDTEDVIRKFMLNELRITHRVELGNVHRFGHGAMPGRRGRPRPIVARFIFYKDLARVLSNTYRLKGKPYGVNQQFPDAIEQARKSLYPIMKQKRADGCHVRLVRDILYVNGQMYTPQTVDDSNAVPAPNSPMNFATPEQRQSSDFNSRTSTDSDFFEISESHHDNSDNIVVDYASCLNQFNMLRKRCSKDVTKNSYGNQLLDMCKNNNLFILNGRVNGDKEGMFTCRQSSVVDYFICTYPLLYCINEMLVHDFSSLYSDVHSPLSLTMLFKQTCAIDKNINVETCADQNVKKINKWDTEKENEFVESIDRNKLSELESELNMLETSILAKENIDKVVEQVNAIILESAEKVLGSHYKGGNKHYDKKKKQDKLEQLQKELNVKIKLIKQSKVKDNILQIQKDVMYLSPNPVDYDKPLLIPKETKQFSKSQKISKECDFGHLLTVPLKGEPDTEIKASKSYDFEKNLFVNHSSLAICKDGTILASDENCCYELKPESTPTFMMNSEFSKMHIKCLSQDGVLVKTIKCEEKVLLKKESLMSGFLYKFKITENINGNICVPSFFQDEVNVFSQDGKLIRKEQIGKPMDVESTSLGSIIVLSLTGQVVILNSNGKFVKNFALKDTLHCSPMNFYSFCLKNQDLVFVSEGKMHIVQFYNEH